MSQKRTHSRPPDRFEAAGNAPGHTSGNVAEDRKRSAHDPGDLADILKKAPLFAALADAALLALAACARYGQYSQGELLFLEGEPCRGLYVVASGLIRIFKTSASGREQVLSVDGPGSSIAELPVFDGGAYPASATAVKQSEAVFVSRDDFRLFCLEHPEVALKVLEVVVHRLRRLVGIVEELSFTTVRQRLIAYILKNATSDGRPAGSNLILTVPGNYQAIAAEIGTVRDLVARNLVRLQAEGLLAIHGREITIIDIQRLKDEQTG